MFVSGQAGDACDTLKYVVVRRMAKRFEFEFKQLANRRLTVMSVSRVTHVTHVR